MTRLEYGYGHVKPLVGLGTVVGNRDGWCSRVHIPGDDDRDGVRGKKVQVRSRMRMPRGRRRAMRKKELALIARLIVFSMGLS